MTNDIRNLEPSRSPDHGHRGSIQIFVPFGPTAATLNSPVATGVDSHHHAHHHHVVTNSDDIRNAVWADPGASHSFMPITPIHSTVAIPISTTNLSPPPIPSVPIASNSNIITGTTQVITATTSPRIVVANPALQPTVVTLVQPGPVVEERHIVRHNSQHTVSRIVHEDAASSHVSVQPDYTTKIQELQRMVAQLEHEQTELRQNFSFGQGLVAGITYAPSIPPPQHVVDNTHTYVETNNTTRIVNNTTTTNTTNTNTNTNTNVNQLATFKNLETQQTTVNREETSSKVHDQQIYILSKQLEEYRQKYEEVTIDLREYRFKYEESAAQLEDYRLQYEEVVKSLHQRQDESSKLRELAEAYEELDASHKNLQRLLEETDTKLNQANLKIAVHENNKNQDAEIRNHADHLDQQLQQKNALVEQLYAAINKAQEEAEQAHQDRQEMRRYVQEEQQRIFSYQAYTESVANEYKQLMEEYERVKADRESLFAKYNQLQQESANSHHPLNTHSSTHAAEDRLNMVIRSKETELQRMASLLRIKQSEIDQLSIKIQRLQNAPLAYNIPPEFEMKMTNYEKRIEVLTNEIERYNNTLLAKNREICELKSLTFEVDKLNKINIELKNSLYESEKLNDLVIQRNSELAAAKSTIQALERKAAQIEVFSREIENLRTAASEIQVLRDALHKKDLEIGRMKQTVTVKETQVNESLVERDQLRKKILGQDTQLEDLREELRRKSTQVIPSGSSDLERSLRKEQLQLRETVRQMQADRLSARNAERDRAEKQRVLENQVQQLYKVLEKERTEYFNMRKSYEDKLFAAESAKKDAEGREKHHLYDVDLKKTECVRLEEQIQALNGELAAARREIVAHTKTANEYKLSLQKVQSDLEMQAMEFEQVKKRHAVELDGQHSHIRKLEQKVQTLESENDRAKTIIREAKDDAETLKHHFDQAEGRIKNLEQRNRILPSLEQQLVSYQEALRRADTTISEQRAYLEKAGEDINQLQQDLAAKQQSIVTERVSTTEVVEKLKEEISSLQGQLAYEKGLSRPQNPQTKQPQTINSVRRENQALRAQLEEALEKLQYYEHMVDSANQLQNRVYQFQVRLQNLLSEQPSSTASGRGKHAQQHNVALRSLEAIISDLNNRVRKFRGENEQLRRNLQEVSAKQRSSSNIPEGFKKHYDELIEENDELRGRIDQYEARIKEYQKEYIKLSGAHKELGQEFNSLNLQELRKNLQSLESKNEFLKQQNTELEERVTQLLRLNAQLTADAQAFSLRGNNEKEIEYVKKELAVTQSNLTTVQDKLKSTLEELGTVKRQQLAKATNSNADLSKKLATFQNSLYELETKLNVAASEKNLLENEKTQLQTRIQQLLAELKSYRTGHTQAQEKTTQVEYELKNLEEQKTQLTSTVALLTAEVNRLRELSEQLNLDATTYLNQKNMLEKNAEHLHAEINSLKNEVSRLKVELNNSQLVFAETDNLLYYVHRAEGAVKQLEETLPALNDPRHHQQVAYSISTCVGKAIGIFREIEYSKKSIRESLDSLRGQDSHKNVNSYSGTESNSFHTTTTTTYAGFSYGNEHPMEAVVYY